jgi:putative transposase
MDLFFLFTLPKNKTARNKSILKKIAEGQIKILKATVSLKGSKYYVSLALEEVVPQITPLPVSEIEATLRRRLCKT